MVQKKPLFTSITVVGIVCVILSIVGIVFLYDVKGSVVLEDKEVSNTFYLRAGSRYDVYVIEEDYPVGYGEGMIVLIDKTNDQPSKVFRISFNFENYDGKTVHIVLGTLSVNRSGNYYLLYFVESDYHSSKVRLEIQEPLIRSLLGIDESFMLIIGMVMTIGGVLGLVITKKKHKDDDQIIISEDKAINELQLAESVYHEFENEIVDDSLSLLTDKYVICPYCGNKTKYNIQRCETCGSAIRKDNKTIDFI